MNPRTVVLVHGEWGAIQTLRSKLVLKHIVYSPQNGETIDLSQQPDWISEYTLQKIDAEKLTYYGTVETTEDEIVFRFNDKNLLNSPLWQQFFVGYNDVKAKWMGKWLQIRGLGPGEETDEE